VLFNAPAINVCCCFEKTGISFKYAESVFTHEEVSLKAVTASLSVVASAVFDSFLLSLILDA
jgi:hypothetical protein